MSDVESSFLKEQSISMGADLFVEKPVDMDKVVGFLSSHEAAGSLSGVVKEVDIIEHLQFIMLNGKKLVLEVISNGSAEGEIFVCDGKCTYQAWGIAGRGCSHRSR